MWVRSAPVDHGQHDVVDRAAQRVLDRLELRRGRRRPTRSGGAGRSRRCSGLGGAPCMPARSHRAEAAAARAQPPARLLGMRERVGRGAQRASGAVARSAQRVGEQRRRALGSGRGNHGGRRLGRRVGVRPSRSNSTVAMSTPEMPSTRQWWVFADHREAAALDAVDEPDLPQRLARGRAAGRARARPGCAAARAGGLGQRGVAHVVAGVEVRVVDPHRPRLRRAAGTRASGGSAGRGAGASRAARRTRRSRAPRPRRAGTEPTCMWAPASSRARKDASRPVRRSGFGIGARLSPTPTLQQC